MAPSSLVPHVQFSGELDLDRTDEMRAVLWHYLEPAASDVFVDQIVVDLGPVTFLDSSALRVLVAADQAVTSAGWHPTRRRWPGAATLAVQRRGASGSLRHEPAVQVVPTGLILDQQAGDGPSKLIPLAGRDSADEEIDRPQDVLVDGACLRPAGPGELDSAGAPVTGHRAPFDEAAPIDAVDQTGHCRLLDSEDPGQLGHRLRSLGQHTQQPCLSGSEVAGRRGASEHVVDEAGQVHQPGGQVGIGLIGGRDGIRLIVRGMYYLR